MRNKKPLQKVSFYFITLAVLFLFSCEEEESGSVISISSGTSFGECGGYCVRTLEIDSEMILYTASGYDPVSYPDLTVEASYSNGEWNAITALVDFGELQSYADIVGCPDCADGGAEWIQVEMNDGIKKIIFEYGDTLETIQPLIDMLRTLRIKYELQLFAEQVTEKTH